MRTGSGPMTGAAFALDLRRSRTLIIGLVAVTALYAGFISVFYTNVVENAEQFESLLDAYPKELLVAFGLGEGSFADPGIFLSGYVFNFLWPLVAAIGGDRTCDPQWHPTRTAASSTSCCRRACGG